MVKSVASHNEGTTGMKYDTTGSIQGCYPNMCKFPRAVKPLLISTSFLDHPFPDFSSGTGYFEEFSSKRRHIKQASMLDIGVYHVAIQWFGDFLLKIVG